MMNSGRIDDRHDARREAALACPLGHLLGRHAAGRAAPATVVGRPASRPRSPSIWAAIDVPGEDEQRRRLQRHEQRSAQAQPRTQAAAARHGLAHQQPGHARTQEEDQRVAGRKRRPRAAPRPASAASPALAAARAAAARRAGTAAARFEREEQRHEQRRTRRAAPQPPAASRPRPAGSGRASVSVGPMLPSRVRPERGTRRNRLARLPARVPATPPRTAGARCCAPA